MAHEKHNKTTTGFWETQQDTVFGQFVVGMSGENTVDFSILEPIENWPERWIEIGHTKETMNWYSPKNTLDFVLLEEEKTRWILWGKKFGEKHANIEKW